MSDLGLLISDDYLNNDIEFDKFFVSETAEKEEKISSDKKYKAVKILFIVFCFILIAELVIYKYVMPCFSIPKISVKGMQSYTSEDMSAKLQSMANLNWLNFDAAQAAALISADAGIDNVTVEKRFPNKVLINIEERDPVAVIFLMENGISSSLEIDKNGVLFQNHSRKIMENDNSLPIISGLPLEYMGQGMRIPSKYRPLIEQISKIKKLPQQYFASISEICVLPKEYGNYELALIPAQSKVKVLTDRALNEDALKYMMVVLDVVNQLGSNVSEVDLRYGSVSYRTR